MSIRQICYQGWSLGARDLKFELRHVAAAHHHCGLVPGHDGPCVCRECGETSVHPGEG